MEEEGRDMPDPGADRGRIDDCSEGVVSSNHESNAPPVEVDNCSGGNVHGIDDSSSIDTCNKSTKSTDHDHTSKATATEESKEDMNRIEEESECANPSFAGLLCLAAASDSVAMNLYPVGTSAKLLVGKLSFDIKVTGADYAANPPTNEVEYVLASDPATKITKTVPASFIYNHQVSLELSSSNRSCGNDGEVSSKSAGRGDCAIGSEGEEATVDTHKADGMKDSDKLSSDVARPISGTDGISTTSNGSKMMASVNDTTPSASGRTGSQGKSLSQISEKGDVEELEEGGAEKEATKNVQNRPSKRAAAMKTVSYNELSNIYDKKSTDNPTMSSKGSSKRTTMKGILRNRIPGSEHDSAAIETCVEIIEVLKRKNCVNTNSRLSTKCTCMKSFDANLARPVATFVATTWYNMSASEKVDHVVRLVQQKREDKEDLHLPFRIVDVIQAQKSSSQSSICRNAMCELLGIDRSLWEKIVDALIDGFDTPGSNSAVFGEISRIGRRAVGKRKGRISRRTVGVSLSSNPNHKTKSRTMVDVSPRVPASDSLPAIVTSDTSKMRKGSESSDIIPTTMTAVLKQFKAESENGDTIGACTRFIQKHLMTKTCTNRQSCCSTSCTCIKTLDTSLVRPAAAYVANTWNNMDSDAKVDQLLEWNRNKVDGNLPYHLPLSQISKTALQMQPTCICRNGLAEVLGITSRLWEKVTLAENTAADDDDDETNNGWTCQRCERENEAEKKRCPGCYGWKGGTMDGIRAPALKRARTSTTELINTGFSEDDLKKTAADAAEAAIIALSMSTRVADEVSQIQSTAPVLDEPITDPNVRTCHLCDLENEAERRRCATCMERRNAEVKPKYDSTKCIVEGCEKNRQHKCNKMCMVHFKEELRRDEGVDNVAEPNQLEGVGDGAGIIGTKRKRSSSITGTGNEIPSTMHGVLRLRKPGSMHDKLAIQACADFIRRQLMTKTCINVKSRKITQCCCIKMLKNDQIQSAAKYVATAWYMMSEKQQIQHIVECVQDAKKSNEGLPFILPGTESGAIAHRRNLCRNAFCEILGVSRVLWDKALLAVETSANETDDDDAEEASVSRRSKSAVENAPQRLLKRTAAQIAMSKLGADAETDTEDEGGEEMNASDDSVYLLVPEITKGTSILKYFAEGKSYFEGKIIKLPGPGNSFYHVRYDDGDEEDLEPHEMWIAFSDWCVANNEIQLTQFHPNQNVYAFDRSRVKRGAVIRSFRPVQREGSDKWSWSYLLHFLGWNSRYDEWVDENCIESRATGPKEEFVEKESEAEQESNNNGTPTRKRSIDPDLFVSPNKRQRWCCHRCDTINGPDGTKCCHCNYGKDDEADDESEEEYNQESDEEITDVAPKSFSTRKNECAVEGCTKWVQSHCDGMCHTHHRESLKEMSSIASSDDSEDDADDDENRGFNGNFLCSVEGCEKYRQSGRGGMCCSHFSEAQKKSDNLKEKIVEKEYEEDFEDDDLIMKNFEASFGMKNDEALYVHCTKEKQCVIDGCSRWRHGWQNLCLKHQCEAQVARTIDADDDGEETEENEWTDSEDGGGSPFNTLGTACNDASFRRVYWSDSGKEHRQVNGNEMRNDEVEVEDGGRVEEPGTGIEAVVPKDAVVKEATNDDAEPAEATNDGMMRAVPKLRSVGHEGASLQAVLELLKDSDDEEDDEDLFG